MAKKDLPVDKETKQLTIRLDNSTIEELDDMAMKMQKAAPSGVNITRTDALRTAIIQGIAAHKAAVARRR